MTSIRARVADVRTHLAALLREDAVTAAGNNSLVSRSEQAAAPAHVKDAADTVRAAGGSGARVSVDALSDALLAKADAFIALVNQPSGSGAQFLSKREVASVLAQSPGIGARVQRAYELALNRGGVDVDAAVRNHLGLAPGESLRSFASEAEATSHQEPSGDSVRWLVVTGETSTTKSFVTGTNDLWAQRFDVSKLDGSVTITAEH